MKAIDALKNKLLRIALQGGRVLHRSGLAKAPPVRYAAASLKRVLLRTSEGLSVRHRVVHRPGLSFYIPYSLASNYAAGGFEPGTTALLQRCLRPGMVAVDVGANVGWHTLTMAERVGPRGHVYAVEPAEGNLEFLRKNVEANGFANVTVLACAAGAADQTRTFHLRSRGSLHGFYAHPLGDTVRTVEVEEKPLDDVIEKKIDFVKMDVEGGEVEALRGMKRLLATRPQVLVEWNPGTLERAGYAPNDLPDLLREQGYMLRAVQPDGSLSALTPEEEADRSAPAGRLNLYGRGAEAQADRAARRHGGGEPR